jgi:hypothetical protein
MSSLLKQITDDESLLLMYLVDELSAADRAAVDHRLSADPSLRQQLEALQFAYASTNELLEADDRATPLPVSTQVAARRVSRLMAQWQVDRAVSPRQTPAAPVVGLRYPWWIYPTSAAAALFLAFLVWWGHSDRGPSVPRLATGGEVIVAEANPPADEDALWIIDTLNSPSEEHIQELASLDAEADELASVSQGTDSSRDLFDTISDSPL